MVIYNAATRELTAKIVYYGPGLCGKTTNLKVLHDRLEPGTAGKLLNLQTQTDRTIYFDLLPVELGDIKGYKIRFQLATVPGQTAFNETRRVVLKGVDGIVFVADSQWTMLPKNLESLAEPQGQPQGPTPSTSRASRSSSSTTSATSPTSSRSTRCRRRWACPPIRSSRPSRRPAAASPRPSS